MPFIYNNSKNEDELLIDSITEGLCKILQIYSSDDKCRDVRLNNFFNFLNDVTEKSYEKKPVSAIKVETILKSVIAGLEYDVYNTMPVKEPPAKTNNYEQREKLEHLIKRIDEFVSNVNDNIPRNKIKSRYTDHLGFIQYLSEYYKYYSISPYKEKTELNKTANMMIDIYKKILFNYYMENSNYVKNVSLFVIRNRLCKLVNVYTNIIDKEVEIHTELNNINIIYRDEIVKCLNLILDFIISSPDKYQKITIKTLRSEYMKTTDITIFESMKKTMDIVLLYIEYFYPVYEKYTNNSIYYFIEDILETFVSQL